jgi:hypothetical protein
LRDVLNKAFALLPEQVYGIVEIGSRDAYRTTDVFLGDELIPRSEFRRIWSQFEPFLVEDGSVAAGANSEDPFIEVFLDQWKGVTIHVPADRREEVERMLQGLGLSEVPETWSDDEDGHAAPADAGIEHLLDERSYVRSVLDTSDEFMPDVDELLLQLRHAWRLELNVDPRTNVDESGRALGATLWYAVALVHDASGKSENGAYVSAWATASCLMQVEQLIEEALANHPEWEFGDIYTIDRVAFDERPEELADLKPNDRRPRVHSISFDKWNDPPQPPRPPEASKHQR